MVVINMTACGTNDISRPDDDNPMGNERPSDSTISNPDEAVNPTVGDKAPMSGMVNLWYKGRVPSVTKNVNNSDGPEHGGIHRGAGRYAQRGCDDMSGWRIYIPQHTERGI